MIINNIFHNNYDFLFCAILKIWKAKSSSQIGAFFEPNVCQMSSRERANIGCSIV